jgi:hypothetical protein
MLFDEELERFVDLEMGEEEAELTWEVVLESGWI